MPSDVRKIFKALWGGYLLVGGLVLVVKPLWRVVQMVSDLDFLLTHANEVLAFLDTGWGSVSLGVVGLGIITLGAYRNIKKMEPEESPQPERRRSSGWGTSSASTFEEQFERYDSFTVEEAIGLLSEEMDSSLLLFAPTVTSSLSPKRDAAKHLIIAEYKAGHIALDHFSNPARYSEEYSKSRISKAGLLVVADKMENAPEFMVWEAEEE